ncbi:MAG TPA: PQQ-binding-like beta-propeller repeat protein [Mycobacteriales bacterium]|jgi:outer membrane protein assembly factor BamB|nr:PQQ-binding-like beta-propeller repeat protein [Mycobacteriales bacterium]
MRRCLRRALAVVLAAGCLPLTSAAAAPAPPSAWYQPGAYAGHSGSNDSETVVTAATVGSLGFAWRVSGPTSPPLVSGGRAWTVGADAVLRSFDVATGAPRTRTPVGRCTAGAVPPVMSSTVVLVPTTGCDRRDSVRAFSAGDGRALWQRELPNQLSSATVRLGVLYLTGGHGSVTALDADDGQQRWARSGGQSTVLESAVSDGLLYTTTFGVVQARRLGDGRVLWTRPAGEYNSSVAAVGGRVYVSYVNGAGAAGDQRLIALTSTGTELWEVFVGGGISSAQVRPSISGDTVLVPTVQGQVVALDTATGRQRWASDIESDDLSTVSVAGGVAYTVEDGTLFGRDVRTGVDLVARPSPRKDNEPVVAAGHVLVSGDGLRVFEPKAG